MEKYNHVLSTNNLHTVIWFQVFLSNTNNFYGTLIDTIAPSLSDPGTNGNEGVTLYFIDFQN